MGGFMRIAHVWMEHARLNQTFTYDCGSFDVQAGMRVSVGFGNQTLVAFVDHVEEIQDRFAYEQECGYQLKSILDVIDVEPIFNSELMDLGKWMAYQTLSTVISCYQAMLPNKLKPKSSSGNIKKDIFVHFVKDVEGLTKKQIELLPLADTYSENTMYLQLDEIEIETLSNAVVEAAMIEGAYLYANKYVEAGMQDQAKTTYYPSWAVIQAINSNENITHEAKTTIINRYNTYAALVRGRVDGNMTEDALDNAYEGIEEEVATKQEQRKQYLDSLAY
jgi:primosomal protein N'